MLHLLNSIPQKRSDWQLIESMLSGGDEVLFYDNAVKIFDDADVVPILLTWFDQGINLFLLEDNSGKNKPLAAKALANKVTLVDWQAVVDLAVHANVMQSL